MPRIVNPVPPDTAPVFGLIDVTVGAFSGAGVSSYVNASTPIA